MKTNEVVKKRISELVNSTGISKTEHAKHIGISYSTINKFYSHGENVRIRIIYQIATYFNVSSDNLLGLSDNKEIKSHRY